jgi:hypothetical protein
VERLTIVLVMSHGLLPRLSQILAQPIYSTTERRKAVGFRALYEQSAGCFIISRSQATCFASTQAGQTGFMNSSASE